jgi:hypothetical protein
MFGFVIGSAVGLSIVIALLALWGVHKVIVALRRAAINYKRREQEVLDIRSEEQALTCLYRLLGLHLYYQREVIRNMQIARGLPSYVPNRLSSAMEIISYIEQMRADRRLDLVRLRAGAELQLRPVHA